MSGIDIRCANSISASASRNGKPRRADSRRPMVDLPAPIIPTSTTERTPKATVISASWRVLALTDEAVSAISFSIAAAVAALHATILPTARLLLELLQAVGKHGGSQIRLSP